MRDDASITPEHITKTALQMLKQYGLNPLPHSNTEADLDNFIETVLEPKRLAHASGNEGIYNEAATSEFLSDTEQEALRLLNEKPRFRLKDALDYYLDMHVKANEDTFRTYNTRIWNRFVNLIGNKPFEEVSRADSHAYINKLLTEGLKIGSVRRNLSVVGAFYNHCLVVKEINKANPFKGCKVASEDVDMDKRDTFNADQLQILKAGCLAKDDDLRWALAMQMDLGSRIGEIVGLTLDDIVLDHETPHVNFEPKHWRSIKTYEQHFVPLIGMALWAALNGLRELLLQTSSLPSQGIYPEGKTGKTKRDATSATLNKCLESLGVDRTTHELRHTMRDRLRNVNASSIIKVTIGGWGKSGVGDTYGKGYELRTLQEWLLKVVQ
jgi:integrase